MGRHNAALKDLKNALTLSSNPVQQSDICFRSGLSDYALPEKFYLQVRKAAALNTNSEITNEEKMLKRKEKLRNYFLATDKSNRDTVFMKYNDRPLLI